MKKVWQVFYKMRYYFLIIFLCGAILSLIDSFVLYRKYNLPFYLSIIFVYVSIIMVIIIDGLTALVIHHLPEKLMEPERFKEHKWEKKFFKIIKIRKWKDYIPEIGGLTADFAKDKIENPSSSTYLHQFLIEIGYAEVIHTVSFFTGFLIIFILPFKYFIYIGLPIAVINIIFNLLSALIQRYNRPKFLVVYNRALKKEANIEIEKTN